MPIHFKPIPDLTDAQIDKFWSNVEMVGDDECWMWIGSREPRGYGRIWLGSSSYSAHRISWTISRGPIPEGLTIDHTCENKSCINPDHLEPVTARVNNLRSGNMAGRNARKTLCPNGHTYDTVNGSRRCSACTKARTKKWRQDTGRGGFGRTYERKTHCKNGHRYEKLPDGRNKQCRQCKTALRREKHEASGTWKGL